MRAAVIFLMLTAAPASAQNLYALYAAGKYDEAMHAGAAANNSEGYAIAARAALADAAMHSKPCLSCLKRAEDFARHAIAANPKLADGHVWLAAALGLESRAEGLIRARLEHSPSQARGELAAALHDDPRNAYAVAALGAWNIEIVHVGGAYLARKIYEATVEQGLAQFDSAVALAPGNVAVRYQIGLTLAGYAPDAFKARIATELGAAIHAAPQSAYEKIMQAKAAELLALQKKNDPASFAAKVREFQGYPD